MRLSLPPPLRRFAGGDPEVAVEGGDVASLLESLAARYPQLAQRLLDDSGQVRRFASLYLNGVDVRRLGGPRCPVGPGDRLAVVLALAGG